MDLTVFEQEMIRKIDELLSKITECQSTLINLEKNENVKDTDLPLFKEKVYDSNKLAPICLNKLDHLLMFSPKKTID